MNVVSKHACPYIFNWNVKFTIGKQFQEKNESKLKKGNNSCRVYTCKLMYINTVIWYTCGLSNMDVHVYSVEM
jgi:hypothetical protein